MDFASDVHVYNKKVREVWDPWASEDVDSAVVHIFYCVLNPFYLFGYT